MSCLFKSQKGTLILYAADEPGCAPHVVQAGQSFIEPIGKVHIARNESPTDRASWYATHIGVPSGVPTTTDEPAPGNCAF
jgi:quercetin dioxygenase-like cupin family protein